MMNLAKWLISAFHGIRVAGHTSTRHPYTGDELRAIRKRNGVGKRHNRAARTGPWVAMARQANAMAAPPPPPPVIRLAGLDRLPRCI